MNRYLFSVILAALMLVGAMPAYASAIFKLLGGDPHSAASFDPAKLEYRIADGARDLDDLLELYEGFSTVDHHRLLVWPSGRVRRKMLGESVRDGKIFIARDPEKNGSNQIVSFCKLYIAEGNDACSTISDELSAGVFLDIEDSDAGVSTKFEPCVPAFIKDYTLTQAAINNFAQRLPHPDWATEVLLADFATKREHGVGFDLNPARDVILYYGSAYTLEEYRDCHVNTTLEHFALNHVKPAVCARLRSGANLVYMYGVVVENFWGSARLRSFVNFAYSLFTDPSSIVLPVSVTMFDAKKPVFEARGSRAILSPSPQVKRLLSASRSSGEDSSHDDTLMGGAAVDYAGFVGSPSACLSPIPVISRDEFIKGYGCFISCRMP